MKVLVRNGILIFVVLATAVGCGCGGHVDDHMAPADVKAADRIEELARKSEGNFDKLTEKEQQYVLDAAMGSEDSARLLLKGKAAGFKAQKGPPPPEDPKAKKKSGQ